MLDETVMFCRRDCGPTEFLALRTYLHSPLCGGLTAFMQRNGCFFVDWIVHHKYQINEWADTLRGNNATS